MPRVPSTNYNQYLNRFTPFFLRKYQTGTYFKTGRSTNYQTLVYKYMCDNLSTEEDHSFKHKTPIWIVNFSHRVSWALTIYYMVYCSIFLGKQHKIFNLVEKVPGGAAQSDTNLPYRYEDVYVLDKKVNF